MSRCLYAGHSVPAPRSRPGPAFWRPSMQDLPKKTSRRASALRDTRSLFRRPRRDKQQAAAAVPQNPILRGPFPITRPAGPSPPGPRFRGTLDAALPRPALRGPGKAARRAGALRHTRSYSAGLAAINSRPLPPSRKIPFCGDPFLSLVRPGRARPDQGSAERLTRLCRAPLCGAPERRPGGLALSGTHALIPPASPR